VTFAAKFPKYDLSVVIPCLNAASTLGEQLAALAAQEFDGNFEIVVADNGSTDGTIALAQDFAVRSSISLRIVDASRRRGRSVGYNEGIRAARSDLIALCDADDRVHSRWLAALRDAIVETDIVAGTDYSWSGRGAGDSTQCGNPANQGFFGLPELLPFARAGNLCMRRAVFDAIGGFDEGHLAAVDVEFSWRAQLAGFRLVAAPAAIVDYRRRTTFVAAVRQNFLWGFYNVRLFFWKFRDRIKLKRPLGELVQPWSHVLHIARLATRSPQHRHSLACLLGMKLGLIAGSLRYARTMR
jgi:glycosyltransferase involved in cell wall biosynthesis